jgi:IS1 family transposase/transposase-like protein
MAVFILVECPDCHCNNVFKHGFSKDGKQRYRCENPECSRRTFILNHSHPGRTKEVKEKIIEMSQNGSGIRDTARVLKVSRTTVTKELKKKSAKIKYVNEKFLATVNPEKVEVEILLMETEACQGIKEAELDEMWSFVGKKKNQRWLWHAIDKLTGKVLAYVFGRRKDEIFLKLKKLLEPFGIKHYCTDGYGAYQRHLPEDKHEISKKKTQRIEQKHTNLRTRIKRLQRKTICFSKSEEMHDTVIGIFINKYEFGMEL